MKQLTTSTAWMRWTAWWATSGGASKRRRMSSKRPAPNIWEQQITMESPMPPSRTTWQIASMTCAEELARQWQNLPLSCWLLLLPEPWPPEGWQHRHLGAIVSCVETSPQSEKGAGDGRSRIWPSSQDDEIWVFPKMRTFGGLCAGNPWNTSLLSQNGPGPKGRPVAEQAPSLMFEAVTEFIHLLTTVNQSDFELIPNCSGQGHPYILFVSFATWRRPNVDTSIGVAIFRALF